MSGGGAESGNADELWWAVVELMELRLCDDTRALYMLDVLPITGCHSVKAPGQSDRQRLELQVSQTAAVWCYRTEESVALWSCKSGESANV